MNDIQKKEVENHQRHLLDLFMDYFPEMSNVFYYGEPYYDYGNGVITKNYRISTNADIKDFINHDDYELFIALTNKSPFFKKGSMSEIFVSFNVIETIGTGTVSFSLPSLKASLRSSELSSVCHGENINEGINGLKNAIDGHFNEILDAVLANMKYDKDKILSRSELDSSTSFIGIGSASSIQVTSTSESFYDVSPLVKKFGRERTESILRNNFYFSCRGGEKMELNEDGILRYVSKNSDVYD